MFAGALAAGVLLGTAAPAAAECSQISDFSDLALIGDAGDFSDISLSSDSSGCSEDCYASCCGSNDYCRTDSELTCFVDCVKGCS